MFLGQYHHNLDSKDRLTVPARFRELLGEAAYIMQGFDKNLMVLTESAFETVYRRIIQMSITDPLARDLRRLILATATRVDVDKAGRILIQQFLRDPLGLGSEVTLVGQGDYFEIWSPDEWEKRLTQMQDTEANTSRYAALDLATGSE
jgi:MraZ protein